MRNLVYLSVFSNVCVFKEVICKRLFSFCANCIIGEGGEGREECSRLNLAAQQLKGTSWFWAGVLCTGGAGCFSLALKQDRVLQLMEARHRAALALSRIGIIGSVGQLREAASQLVILKFRAHRHVDAVFLLDGVEVLRDVEHFGVVARHQVTGGGKRHLPEGDEMHVGIFDVFISLKAQRLHCDPPAAHHECMTVLMRGVGRDDEQQAVQFQQLMSLLATDPALVW